MNKNGAILKARVNRMWPSAHRKASGMGGSHAEVRLLTGDEDMVLVARFNVPDLKKGIFNPLCAKPCKGCSECIRQKRPKEVWYTNWLGNVELLA